MWDYFHLWEKTEKKKMKCTVCDYDKSEFIWQERIEESGEHISDIGHYQCERCGTK